jgi:hypothetical protein
MWNPIKEVTDWANSALTAPGTHNAMNRDKQNSQVQSQWADAFKSYMPLLTSATDFAKTLQPQYQSNLLQGVNALGQNGVDSSIRDFGAGANERAAQQSQRSQLQMAGMGLGNGAQAGQVLEGQNQAQAATNQFAQQQQSPQARAQRYQMIMQMLQQGMNPQAIMQSLLGMSSGVYGQPQPFVGQSPAGAIGSLAGLATGMNFGGGGGGSSYVAAAPVSAPGASFYGWQGPGGYVPPEYMG